MISARASLLALCILAVTAGCVAGPDQAKMGYRGVDDGQVGSITMTSDGVISVQRRVPDGWALPPPLVIVRSAHPDAYDSYVDMAGGLRLGETKPLIAYAGLVTMNEDMSITVAWAGTAHSADGMVVEPHIERIAPSNSRYADIVSKVPGLKVGKTLGFRD
jgi:hypothetical protein